jgi:hypothetical protein
MNLRRIAALLAVAGLVAILAVGCETGGIASPAVEASLDAGLDALPTDDTSDNVEEPPTLAPVPPGVKAGAKCDAAFTAWVDWWVAFTSPDESAAAGYDPDAVSSDMPPGDPDKLERTVFDTCTLAELGAANAAHPITLDPTESPSPYIEYEVGWFVQGLCDDDSDIIGDSKLCAPYASPAPSP